MRTIILTAAVCALLATPARAQQKSLEEELRAELAVMKSQMARIETLLEQLEKQRAPAGAAPTPAPAAPAPGQAPPAAAPPRAVALNTPGALPLREEAYRKHTPRFDVLLQVRGDFFADTARNDTFFLRKAELGVKGRIAPHIDYVLELDPVRANDAFRRTYVRLSYWEHLHIKLGLEKAPLGLEELISSAQIPFVDRSEVNNRFAPAEELGVHLESHWQKWLLQLSVSNGSRRQRSDDNSGKDVTARAVWGPHRWFSLGAAVQEGSTANPAVDRRRYNAELKVGTNLSGFQSEFYRAKDAALYSSAFYLAGFWAIPLQTEWVTHFQPVVRYEQVDRSDRDPLQELRLATFGFSLMFADHRSKFQVNYLKDLRTGARRDEFRAQYQVEF